MTVQSIVGSSGCRASFREAIIANADQSEDMAEIDRLLQELKSNLIEAKLSLKRRQNPNYLLC